MTQNKINMIRHYTQLSPVESGQIEAWRTPQQLPDGTVKPPSSIATIARRLGRNKATISREIKRGTTTQIKANHQRLTVYLADTGQSVYERHRQFCHLQHKWQSCTDFYKRLTDELKRRPRIHSVDSFVHAYRQTFPNRLCPSTPTVYRDINVGVLALRNSDLPRKLRRRIKGAGHRHARINQHVLGQSITERPINVADRTGIGHWEGDLVKSQQTQDDPALITLTERVTRFQIIFKIPNYHTDTCQQGLQTILADYGAKTLNSLLLIMVVSLQNYRQFKNQRSILRTHIHRGNGELMKIIMDSFENLSRRDIHYIIMTLR